MRDNLRSYEWVVEAIAAVENGKIYDLDLVGVQTKDRDVLAWRKLRLFCCAIAYGGATSDEQ